MRTRSGELPALTGLRGFAALMVVLYHANVSPLRGENDYKSMIIFQGHMFVDLFFVLSGFLISYVYLGSVTSFSKFDWRSFFSARLARVYPLHIITALFAGGGLVLLHKVGTGGWPSELNFREAIREVTLTQAMPLLGADEIWNSPSWSVSVEFWTYILVFPVLVALNKKMGMVASVLLAVAITTVAVVWFSSAGIAATRGWPALFRASSGFILGWAIWKFYSQCLHLNVPAWVTDLSFILLLVITQVLPHLTNASPWFILYITPVLLVGSLAGESVTKRLMESAIFVFLGNISYSLYLLHPLVLKVVQILSKYISGMNNSITFSILLTLFITVPFSWISYRFFEQPARKFIKDRTARKKIVDIGGIRAGNPPAFDVLQK